MRRYSPFQINNIEHMPVYNRTHGRNKLSDDGDFALLTHKKIQYLEKEIKAEDTLLSISLEFNVPVSELKRVNNIHKDNEIYARKIIKVPSNPFSLLLEKEYFSKIEAVEGESPPVQAPVPKYDPVVEAVNSSSCNPRTSDCTDEDKEDESLLNSNKGNKERDESVLLLTPTVDNNNKSNDVMSCNGADWGISWHVLIVFTFLLGVGGPVLYVLWLLRGKSHKAEGS